MSCQQTHELIHGYVDGELDLVKSLEIEQHLAGCPSCSQTHKNLRVVSAVMRGEALRFQPPPDFEKRLRSTLRREDKHERKPGLLQWPWLLAATLCGAYARRSAIGCASSTCAYDDGPLAEILMPA